MNNLPERTAIAWEIRKFYELATLSVEIRLLQRLAEAGIQDIRPAHFKVFEYLPPEGARLTDLARNAQATKQAMSYLVDDLVELGYLERIPDPTDGRANLIRRSARGIEAEKIAVSAVAEKDSEWRDALGSEQYTRLAHILSSLNSEITEELNRQQ